MGVDELVKNGNPRLLEMLRNVHGRTSRCFDCRILRERRLLEQAAAAVAWPSREAAMATDRSIMKIVTGQPTSDGARGRSTATRAWPSRSGSLLPVGTGRDSG